MRDDKEFRSTLLLLDLVYRFRTGDVAKCVRTKWACTGDTHHVVPVSGLILGRWAPANGCLSEWRKLRLYLRSNIPKRRNIRTASRLHTQALSRAGAFASMDGYSERMEDLLLLLAVFLNQSGT